VHEVGQNHVLQNNVFLCAYVDGQNVRKLIRNTYIHTEIHLQLRQDISR
jgi:hypothetical protein